MPKFHMVRSVKGGSGKTAFALRKVVDLARDEVKKDEDAKKIIYIDADVHASETYSRLVKEYSSTDVTSIIKQSSDSSILLPDASTDPKAYFINFYDERIPNKPNSKHYLNTYIHPYCGYYSKLEEIMLPAKLRNVKPAANSFELDMKKEL